MRARGGRNACTALRALAGTVVLARVALLVQAAPAVREYPIRPVPLTSVKLTDSFWRPRLETNRTVTIPHILRQNELTGRVANFLKAAHKIDGAYQGQRYNDTDVYKVMEAASYTLAQFPDARLDNRLDELIAIVAGAQAADGYLYTPRNIDPKNPAPGAGPERWSWLHTSHELYDQGHMIEAAVAHFQATGKRSFLNVAIKSADLICRTFGPEAKHDVPGHEEIELALVKLFRATADRKYLDQAAFFLNERGRPHTTAPVSFEAGSRFAMYNDLVYRQDHQPVAEHPQAVGHAVRATYLYAGMTDAATLLDDTKLGTAVDTLWHDVTSKRMYVTGGLGSDGRTEAFGADYALPNRAYAETCASIGGMLWYHRMFLREGDAKYYDTLERTLYNGYLSGVSLAGDTFFYQNPLISNGTVERSAYFDVACCPANLARLMAQLPGLVYAQRGGDIFVNLFIGSAADIVAGSTRVHVTQETNYPWDGGVTIRVDPERAADLTLAVRVPGWSRGEASPGGLYRFANPPAVPVGRSPEGRDRRTGSPTLQVNGKAVPLDIAKGFARIARRWQRGDVVRLTLPMPVRRVLAHEAVVDNLGTAAIQRGPIVYCVEAVDNGGGVTDRRLPLDTPLEHHFQGDLLHGVEVVTGNGLVAVPYFAWGNRGKGEMAVWIPSR